MNVAMEIDLQAGIYPQRRFIAATFPGRDAMFSDKCQTTNEDASEDIGMGMKKLVKVTFPEESDKLQAAEIPSKNMQISTGMPSPLEDMAIPFTVPEK